MHEREKVGDFSQNRAALANTADGGGGSCPPLGSIRRWLGQYGKRRYPNTYTDTLGSTAKIKWNNPSYSSGRICPCTRIWIDMSDKENDYFFHVVPMHSPPGSDGYLYLIDSISEHTSTMRICLCAKWNERRDTSMNIDMNIMLFATLLDIMGWSKRTCLFIYIQCSAYMGRIILM